MALQMKLTKRQQGMSESSELGKVKNFRNKNEDRRIRTHGRTVALFAAYGYTAHQHLLPERKKNIKAEIKNITHFLLQT